MLHSHKGSTGTAVQELPDPEPFGAKTNKLELLSAMDIFQDLPEADINALMDMSPIHTARKGATIYGPDGPEVLFLLKSGRAELFRLSSDGKKLTLAIVEAGTFIGEMVLVGLRLEGTYAVALEDSVICALSRHDVESLILNYPPVALRFIETLAHRLQETRNSLQDMIFSDLTGRVASLLLNVGGKDGVVEGYSHQDLAAMVGCLRESFTAVLDRFKRTHAVDTGRRHIQILDRAQLERVVEQRA